MSDLATTRRQRWLAELTQIGPKLIGTLGTSGVAAVLGLVSGTLAARVLGPSSRGELAQLLLWPQLVVTLGNMGIELGAVYVSGDPVKRRDAPASVLAVALAESAILVPVYLVLATIVFAGTGLTRDALLMAPLIPMYLIGAVSIDVLAGRLRFSSFNIVRIALPIAYCAAIVALAVNDRLSPLSGALAFAGAHACSDLLALFLVWREDGLGSFDAGIARDALHFGVRGHFGRMSPQGLSVDTAIIALLLSSHDVGLYAAASAFLAAPGLIASSMGMVVFPQASAMHQSGKRLQLQATFALHAGAVAVLSVLLIVFARPLVTLLFGSSYSGGVTALRFLAAGTIFAAIRGFPIEVLRGIGRPGLTSIAEGANWVLFLIAVPIGAVTGGLAGTAAAVAAASCASLGVLVVLIWRSGAFASDAHVAPPTSALEAAA